jgi:hypothetical protein
MNGIAIADMREGHGLLENALSSSGRDRDAHIFMDHLSQY